MLSHFLRSAALVSILVGLLTGAAAAAGKPAGLDQTGKPNLKSVGALAFGPPGVLFVGDPRGAALFAIGVESASAPRPASELRVEGIDAKLAGLLGTKADEILINDLAVQPGTGTAFLSVSRGKGPDAEPVLARVTAQGRIDVLPLDKVSYARISLKNAPSEEAKDRRGNSLRLESITDLHYLDGRVYIAGLSNEEFASKLRSVSFPFEAADLAASTSVEIYHGAHGGFETQSPVRTFVPFVVHGEPHLLAAYTCTPLVTIPISQLKPGSKLQGKTVAELGNMNRPLDIITYEKDGRKFLLMANNNRGVMKIATDNIEKQEAITEKINGKAGLNYETIAALKGVEQLDRLGDELALLLVRREDKGLNLESVPLP